MTEVPVMVLVGPREVRDWPLVNLYFDTIIVSDGFSARNVIEGRHGDNLLFMSQNPKRWFSQLQLIKETLYGGI